MQEGSFRCDANVSIRKVGEKKLGTRTELKNINSFKFVEKAINYEVQRQIDLLEEGKRIIQETRLYDENKNITKSMRSKEEANDYRYFPDPDLLPIKIDDEYILEIKKNLPDLPDVKEKHYKSKYALTDEQIKIILSNQGLSEFVDKVLEISKIDAKKIVNYFISSIYKKMNKENILLLADRITPEDFYLIVESIETRVVTKNNLMNLVDEIWVNKKIVSEAIESFSNNNENDELINNIIKDIVNKNQKQVLEYKSGKTKILGFFIGQTLKQAKGSDPSFIKKQVIKILDTI